MNRTFEMYLSSEIKSADGSAAYKDGILSINGLRIPCELQGENFDPAGAFMIPEVCLKVEADVSPVIPAKTYGRPEDCYPEEGGEVHVTAVVTEDGQQLDLDKIMVSTLVWDTDLGKMISGFKYLRDDLEDRIAEMDLNGPEEDLGDSWDQAFDRPPSPRIG